MTNTLIQAAIPIPYDQIAAFCEKHHVRRMWLFGSVLRGDFTPQSDVDVLVDFDKEHVPGWEFYGRWPEELAEIFGYSVDLSSPDSLRPWLRPQIMESAKVIYERPDGP